MLQPLLLLWAQTDALAGGAGWAGVGLLGGVLSWLLFVHLPGKDKQVEKLVAQMTGLMAIKDEQIKARIYEQAEEREKERSARHLMADQSQKLVMDVTLRFQQTLQEIRNQHKDDGEKDRAAFLERSTHLEDAI